MDMKQFTALQLLVALALFQIALIGLVVQDVHGDSLSTGQLSAVFMGAPLAKGARIPEFAAYTSSGAREAPLKGQRPTTMIFSGCGCDISHVTDWISSAVGRGEDVVVVLQTGPKRLDWYRDRYKLSGRLLAIRRGDFQALRLPRSIVAAHVAADGTILGVQH